MSKKWVKTDSPAALYLTFCLNDQSLIRSEELHNAPPPSVACCSATLRTCAVVQDTSEPWNWYTVINYPLHLPSFFDIYYTSAGSLRASRVANVVQRRSFVSLQASGANEANVTRRINYASGRVTRQGGMPTHHTHGYVPRLPDPELLVHLREMESDRCPRAVSPLWCVCAFAATQKEKKCAGGRKSDVSFAGGSGAKSCNT